MDWHNIHDSPYRRKREYERAVHDAQQIGDGDDGKDKDFKWGEFDKDDYKSGKARPGMPAGGPAGAGFEDDDLDDLEPKKPKVKRKKTTCAKILTFMLSEIGLLFVVAFFIIIGGLLFMWIELPAEEDNNKSAWQWAVWINKNQTDVMPLEIDNIIERAQEYETVRMEDNTEALKPADKELKASGENPRDWAVAEIKKILDKQQQRIATAIEEHGYDGKIHGSLTAFDDSDIDYGWSLASSILFAATILTTIGYGHVSPASETGQLVVILYGVLSVPIMSIFLMKVGAAVARLVIFVYNKVACRVSAKRRDKNLVKNVDEALPTKWDGKKLELDPSESKAQRIMLSTRYHYGRAPVAKLFVGLLVTMYLLFGALVFSQVTEEGWSLTNGFYCAFITMTTLGFGDYVPGMRNVSSWGGRFTLLFVTCYIMVGLALIGMALAIMTGDTSDLEDDDGVDRPPTPVRLKRPEELAAAGKGGHKQPKTASSLYGGDDDPYSSQPPPVKAPPQGTVVGTDTANLPYQAQKAGF